MTIDRIARVATGVDRRWVRGLWPAAAIVALVLLFFRKLALSNLILARGDVFLYFYPYWEMAAEALRAGRVPLWNPSIFMGVPFLANSQAGFFYPLNWPLWLLRPVPYALSASIVLHVILAGWGTYLAGRRLLGLRPVAALLAAALFALGGYLTAQVEHINQLQGLAWLPWFFVALAPVAGGATGRRVLLRSSLAVAALFALQILAGHTQTVFISGVALGIWSLAQLGGGRATQPTTTGRLLGVLAAAAVLAAALAGAQLLPTLELTGYSSREGGLTLNEVLSFSWHPLHLARAILPTYGQSLFTEYVMTVPITGLVLALVCAWTWRRDRAIAPLVMLAAAAMLLALGRFTPLYWLLGNLPGFDLFRVPARWLAPAALMIALLAGRGWMVVTDAAATRRDLARPLGAAAALLVGLGVWGYAGRLLVGLVPVGAEAPYEAPSVLTLVGWLTEAGLLVALLAWGRRRGREMAGVGLLLVSLAVLWLSTRALPYNHPTTPEAYFDLRPPIARLQALGACAVPDEPCPVAPERLLGLSDIFFDPGDQAEIDTIYVDQLDAAARYDYTVAIKHKEVLSPNLPMSYGLASVDGFDGGILPLRAWSRLMGLILPAGTETADGRLREYLDAVPAARWLDLFGARYIITDKTADLWRDGVFYDRQLPLLLRPGKSAKLSPIDFEATELRLLAAAPPQVMLTETDVIRTITPEPAGEGLYVVGFAAPVTPRRISLRCPAGATGGCDAAAATLVDARDGAFQPLTPDPFRLILSGDVKLYDTGGALGRAFLVHDWRWAADEDAAIAAMAEPSFDPARTAILTGPAADDTTPMPGLTGSTAVVVAYEPERVVVQTSSAAEALLVLTDAAYPGWQATIDGAPVAIHTADGLFRGVFVPSGEHEIVFEYRPTSFRLGVVLSLLGLAVWVGGLVWARRREDA